MPDMSPPASAGNPATAREEVRAFLASHLPENWTGMGALDPTESARFRTSWRAALAESGYLVPAWPAAYGGRDASVEEQMSIAEEWVRAGVPPLPHPNDAVGILLLGPTLLRWGTQEQRDRFLPATVRGGVRWAQGYSEPEAGSDLFGLRTRAEPAAGGWRVSGHKIWQTAGLTANWMFVLARTDPQAAASKGISFMVLPLDQQGVEVRGIQNPLGEEEFAEVRLTNAFVAADDVIGGVHNGARVALTLLGFERALAGYGASLANIVELDRLAELARAKGKADDPLTRGQLARCRTRTHALRCISRGALERLANGQAPGPEASVIKLVSSEYRHSVTTLARTLLGADILYPSGADGVLPLGPQLKGLDPYSPAAWIRDYIQARPVTVYGGSSQIQRNTIAEHVLGMPKDPSGRPPTQKT
jgi:hypothetical protein